MPLTQSDFEHQLELRTGLRRFLRWSERQARAVGLTPAKHQLLLAIKGHPDTAGPTIGELAGDRVRITVPDGCGAAVAGVVSGVAIGGRNSRAGRSSPRWCSRRRSRAG